VSARAQQQIKKNDKNKSKQLQKSKKIQNPEPIKMFLVHGSLL